MNILKQMSEKDSAFGKFNDSTGTAVVKYWPIVSAMVLVSLSLGGLYVKLEYIIKILDRNESQFQIASDRQTLTSQSIIEIRGQLNNQNETNTRTAQTISEISRRLDQVVDKQRWTPK